MFVDLADKVVFVTGASSGIGRAVAGELARRRCRLLLTALEAAQLEAVVEQLRSDGNAQVESLPADVTDPSSRKALVEWVRSRSPALDVVVSNAGGGRFARFSRASWDDLHGTIALNVEAPTHLLRELLPGLKARPEARIVIVSSGIGRLPYPGLAVYGASKGYLSSLGETLACELLGTRVGVLVFFPGFTRTGFMDAAGMDMSRVPGFMIESPEKVARRIVRCIERNRQWSYSDLSSRLAALAGPLLPSRLRVRILRNLFWRLPDEG
jgi:short-subunit dehydrogenase